MLKVYLHLLELIIHNMYNLKYYNHLVLFGFTYSSTTDLIIPLKL